MAVQMLGIKTKFTDDQGRPLVGGSVHTYYAGTSLPQDTFSDPELTVPNTNPVILDDTGSANIFLKGTYRVRVFDKYGMFVEEQDNISHILEEKEIDKIVNNNVYAAMSKNGGVAMYAPSINAMKNYDLPAGRLINLGDGERSGIFEIVAGDYSQELQNDPYNAFYVPLADDPTASFKVAKRVETGIVNAGWFGVVYDWDNDAQTGTDCTGQLQAAIDAAIEQNKQLYSSSGSIRVTEPLSTNNRPDYRFFNWKAERTIIIFDGDINGLMLQGGAAFQTIEGDLTLKRSNAFYNTGLNTFDKQFYGLRVRNCRHDIGKISIYGFKGAGFIVECTGGNVNGSVHNVSAQDNDVGTYVFGTRDDMSMIQSHLQNSRNFQEGVLVEEGAKFRQWDCFWKGEHNLRDVRENPDYIPITSDEKRFGVVINSHIACNFWIYAEETTGTHDIWLAPEGGSRIFSAIANKDAIMGRNQAYNGRDVYQSTYYSVDKSVEPLRIVGRGMTISSTSQQITMPLTNGRDEYGRLKGTASTIGLESSTKKRDIRLHDDYVELGSSTDTTKRVRITDDAISYPHKTVVSKIVKLTSSEPSSKILLERFHSTTANIPMQGVLRVVASAKSLSTGYDAGLLKYEFIKKSGGIETELSSLSYIHPTQPITSNLLYEVHPDGGVQKAVVCELAYNPGYWGSEMYIHVYYESYNVI